MRFIDFSLWLIEVLDWFTLAGLIEDALTWITLQDIRMAEPGGDVVCAEV
jgi:hypothetical protein